MINHPPLLGLTLKLYSQLNLDFLETINLNGNALNLLKWVKELQPNRPLYVAEFWSGWFDNWGQKHHTMAVQNYTNVFEDMVFHMNSSVNIYMFIGGTNFGFMSGSWVTTSYDYDAPLSESGLNFCFNCLDSRL